MLQTTDDRQTDNRGQTTDGRAIAKNCNEKKSFETALSTVP